MVQAVSSLWLPFMSDSVPVRKKRVDIDGVLLLDKPAGLSSNDALIRAKRLFSARKAGHTGTLDPFATGLLPLCFGEATKFSQDLLDADKTYETVVHLGIRTATGDTEGDVVGTGEVPPLTSEDIEKVLSLFRGDILQVPPMYSALKRDGKPLYEYARAGVELEREARPVTVHELVLLDCALPRLTLRVKCSKGTYIRVLGEDIGKAIGCGAHLESLRRTEVGALTLDSAVTLEGLEKTAEGAGSSLSDALEPVDYLLSSFEAITLPSVLANRFRNGQRLSVFRERIRTSPVPGRRRVYAAENGAFLGTAQLRPDGVLAPERLVSLPQQKI